MIIACRCNVVFICIRLVFDTNCTFGWPILFMYVGWWVIPANTKRWLNAGLALAHRLQRRANIEPTWVRRLMWSLGYIWEWFHPRWRQITCSLIWLSPRDSCHPGSIGPIMLWCWSSVCDAGPTSQQHCINIPCFVETAGVWPPPPVIPMFFKCCTIAHDAGPTVKQSLSRVICGLEHDRLLADSSPCYNVIRNDWDAMCYLLKLQHRNSSNTKRWTCVELCNPSMDFYNFWHTHPLGGVDVPFGVFEILPT